jgi:hypothetical protein
VATGNASAERLGFQLRALSDHSEATPDKTEVVVFNHDFEEGTSQDRSPSAATMSSCIPADYGELAGETGKGIDVHEATRLLGNCDNRRSKDPTCTSGKLYHDGLSNGS